MGTRIEAVKRRAARSLRAAFGAPAPDGVRLEGTVVSNDMVTLEVVLDGQTTSTDIYSFAFDILLSDPSVIQFTGLALEGDVLVPTFPQEVKVLVTQQGDRVIVGVSKTMGGAGNGFGAEERLILSMDFTVNSGSTTLTFDSTPAMKAPTAFDSALGPIPSITFDAMPATISR